MIFRRKLGRARGPIGRRAGTTRRPLRLFPPERLESRPLLASIYWTGLGDRMSWNDPANWDSGSVPGPEDDASIDQATSSAVLLPAGGLTVNSLGTHGIHLDAPSGTITTTRGLDLGDSTFNDGATIVGPTTLTGLSTLNLSPTAGPAQFDIRADLCTISGTIGPQQGVILDGGIVEFAAGSSNRGSITDGPNANHFETLENLGATPFVNDGTVQIDIANSTLDLAGRFENRGQITLNQSILSFQGIYTLVNAAGGMIDATGTIDDPGFNSFTNDGTLGIGAGTAGALVVTGAYVQGATGTLEVDLGGTTAGTTFDQLVVVGKATLAGTLAVSTIDGYLPPQGSSFQVLADGSASGTFATDLGTHLPNGLILRPDQAATGLTLEAEPAADLAVSVSAQPAIVTLGGSVTYTVRVTDDGPGAAPSVVLTDALPPGVPPGSILTSAGTDSISGSTVTANFGPLASGASATLTIIETPTATGSYADSASVVGPGSVDSNPSNDADSSTTSVVPPPSADLSVAIAGPPATTTSGLLTFTATVTNHGPDPATGASLADTLTLPSGARLSSESVSQGTFGITGNAVDANFGTIGAGAVATLTVVVATAASGTFADSAVAASATPDPNPANNSASAVATVRGLASIALTPSSLATIPKRAIALTAQVSVPPGFVAASKSVTFYDGSKALGSATLDASGHASIVVTLPALGKHALSAAYSGDANYTATTSAATTVRIVNGVAGDFDGDGKADVAIFDQTTATFAISYSGGGSRIQQLGNPNDVNIPVVGDFDGDGRTDLAVYDQTADLFFILFSSGGGRMQQLGNRFDRNIPVAGDFDGDGRTDIAVFDQTASTLLVLESGGGTIARQLGNNTHVNIPVAGDFDGDGKADVAVFDQTASVFLIQYSGGGSLVRPLGNNTHVNVPVAGDFDGDGKADLAVYDQTSSVFLALESGGGLINRQFGNGNDVNIPVVGDFDGDGRTDLAVFDQAAAAFLVQESGGGSLFQQIGNSKHKNIPL